MKPRFEDETDVAVFVSRGGLVHEVADETEDELARREYWQSVCGTAISFGVYCAPRSRLLDYGGKRLCRLCFPESSLPR